MRRLLLLLAALAALTALLPALGRAQQGIDILSEEVQSEFPDGIAFKLDFDSEEPVKEVRFRYAIAPDGTRAYGVPECTGVTSVQCTFDLESDLSTFLIPGLEITYSWQIKDHAGNSIETESGRCMYEDDRFQWQTMSEGGLTVWSYAASEGDVRDLLAVGQETLESMGALLGAKVDFPVKVFFYDSAQDMEAVVLARQRSPQPGVIALGEVVVSDTAVVADNGSSRDILRHELSHIVMRQAVSGPFRSLPDWLDEGVAVYGQSQPLGGMMSALEAAIEQDRVLSVRSLSSSTVGETEGSVDLFYGQSYSLVTFLIDEHGKEKFRELLATFREGSRTDDALMQVYGFDQDGLENAWRQSVGLPEREIEQGQQQPSQPLPQITPFGAEGPTSEQEATPQQEAPSAPAQDEDDGLPVMTLTIVALATLVVAAAFAGAAVLLLRRR